MMVNVPRTSVKRKESGGDEELRGETMVIDEPPKEGAQQGKTARVSAKVEGEAGAAGGGKKKKKAKR